MPQTLDNISSYICDKVGQPDAASLALCYRFVNMRYRQIYDGFPWRDATIYATAVNTVSSQNYVVLPTGIDRVISIRCNGVLLDPTDSTFQISAYPTNIDTVGTPLYYEEFVDVAANQKRIRLYPVPNAVLALTIVGKRTPNELTSGSDVPFLRNIDNVLIDFGMGDMLERQRQYGKAQAKFAEATALLDAAQKLETAQTNRPRKTKALTVSGNSLAELTDSVLARCGTWEPDDRILVQDFLRRNYQMVYDAYNWAEAVVIANVNPDGSEIILPHYFDRVISVRNDAGSAQLDIVNASLYFGITPGIFEETGATAAIGFSYLTPVAVALLPPTRERLSLASTNAADKSNVFIMGESNGDIISENLVLNGTTAVQTVNLYDVPLTIAKPVTVGNVTVTGVTSVTLLQTLLASERERKHIRLWMQPAPVANQVCLILGKRRIKPLVQDEDTPALRDCQRVLIDFATSDMFSHLASKAPGNEAFFKSAADFRQRGDKELQTLLDLEVNQGATSQQVIPDVEHTYSNDGNYDTWFLPKGF